mmetsp:Transcript_10035/g.26760  ORF Transcript_10035/g.26760 Transcript_10035/m.26760 type:complete len:97 (+) Transcript_10035:347-637(+)
MKATVEAEKASNPDSDKAAADKAARKEAKKARKDAAAAAERLPDGATVCIQGLRARAELNGTTGQVLSYDEVTSRYGVNVGSESVLIKAANLSLAT